MPSNPRTVKCGYCFCSRAKQNLTFLIANIFSTSITDTVMDMHIWFASSGISGKHKQVVYTCVSQSIDGADYDFKNLLRYKGLKIFDGFNMQITEIAGKLITNLFFGDLFFYLTSADSLALFLRNIYARQYPFYTSTSRCYLLKQGDLRSSTLQRTDRQSGL